LEYFTQFQFWDAKSEVQSLAELAELNIKHRRVWFLMHLHK